MCGIVGFVTKNDHPLFKTTKQSLSSMEYRGYDSSGICVLSQDTFSIQKQAGPLSSVQWPEETQGSCAIGHIRWATHGAPTSTNAHPFNTEHFSLVHNGIIDNMAQLKDMVDPLKAVSETDSELVALVLETMFKEHQSAFLSLEHTLSLLKGQWAFCIMCKNNPRALLFARQGSPLIIGRWAEGFCVVSDIIALPDETEEMLILHDGDYGFITDENVVVYQNKLEVQRLFEPAQKVKDTHQYDNASSFFLQEVKQVPHVAETLLEHYVTSLDPLTFSDDFMQATKIRASRMHLVACGSSYYAAKMGCLWLQTLSGIDAHAFIASEYHWQCSDKRLAMFVSQSGETADILQLFKKKAPTKTLCLVNRPFSALTRVVPNSLLLHAGLEKSVAASKSFFAQIFLLFLISLRWSQTQHPALAKELGRFPDTLKKVSAASDILHTLPYQNVFKAVSFIGSEFLYPLCVEGSLKMKELSYLPSFAHTFINAPLMSYDTSTLLILLVNKHELPLSHAIVAQALASGTPVIMMTNGAMDVPQTCTHVALPEVEPTMFPLAVTQCLHVIAHTIAHALNRNIDQPRNLAKSVTVE